MRPLTFILAAFALGAQAAEPVFTAIGLSIGGDFPGQSFEFQPFHYERGVTVQVLIAADGIISLDDHTSTVTAFTDDKGKDLLKSRTGKTLAKFSPFPKANDAGSAALFSMHSTELPGKGAQSVTVSGSVAIRTATTKELAVTKKLTLAKDAKIEWAGKQFVIKDIEKTGKLMLSLKTEADISDIIELSLTDDAGMKSIAKRRSYSSTSSDGKRSTTVDYEIDAAGNVFDVAIEFWKDAKDTRATFTVTVGLGL